MIHIDSKKFITTYKKLLKKYYGDNAKTMHMNLNSVYKVMEQYQKVGWVFTTTSGLTDTSATATHPDSGEKELTTETRGKEKLVLSLLFLMIEGELIGNIIDHE